MKYSSSKMIYLYPVFFRFKDHPPSKEELRELAEEISVEMSVLSARDSGQRNYLS